MSELKKKTIQHIQRVLMNYDCMESEMKDSIYNMTGEA